MVRHCAACNRRLGKARRSDAKYCSGRCRVRGFRARESLRRLDRPDLGNSLGDPNNSGEIDENSPHSRGRITPLPILNGSERRALRRREKAELRRNLAREYANATGSGICDAYQLGFPDREHFDLTEWTWLQRRDLSDATIERCLFRRVSLALSNEDGTGAKYVVFDIDVHPGRMPEAWFMRRLKLEAERELGRKVSYAEARRRFVATKVARICHQIGSHLDGQVLFESSRWGVHAFVLLDGFLKPAAARALGLEILKNAGLAEGPQENDPEVSIEVFPTERGRSCRMPLTGPARLLDPGDLSRPKHGRRPKTLDVQEMLLLAPLCAPPSPPPEEDGPPEPPGGSGLSGAPTARGEEKISRVDGELDDARVRDLVGRTLSGDAFARVCRYLVREGIPDDASRGASGKLTALLLYAGVDPEEAGRALVRFLRAPHHRATRSRRDGKDRLGWTALWDVRRGVRLEERGIIRFGGIRRRELLALAEEIRAYGERATRAA